MKPPTSAVHGRQLCHASGRPQRQGLGLAELDVQVMTNSVLDLSGFRLRSGSAVHSTLKILIEDGDGLDLDLYAARF